VQYLISGEDDEGLQEYANEHVQNAKLKAIANAVLG